MSDRPSSFSAESNASRPDFINLTRGASVTAESFGSSAIDYIFPCLLSGDDKKSSRVDTTIYDMRNGSGCFVKGVNLYHNVNDIDGLRKYIQVKYFTEDKNIVFDDSDTFSVCCILNEEQLTEVQILISSPLAFEEEFTEVSGEVIRCISVTPDTDVEELLNIYNNKTEASMDGLFFTQTSMVVKRGSVREHGINSLDKGRLFQDCEVDLRVTYFLDEKREMILHLSCRKSDNIFEVKRRLKHEFVSEFAYITNKKLELWLIRHITVLRDMDCIFMNEPLSPLTSGLYYSLAVYVGQTGYVAMPFQFLKENKMVLISPTATPKIFRQAVAKVIHKPAKCLHIKHKGRKVSETTFIAQLLEDTKRNVLKVEFATAKVYTLAVINTDAQSEEQVQNIDIKAYKQETIGDVKQKVAACLELNPFYLQVFLNGSRPDEKLTLHETRIRTEDNVEIVILPNRVRICLRQSKGNKVFLTIDDNKKTTVSQLKHFCGSHWQTYRNNITILFRGSILDDETMTIFDSGIVSDSVLIVNGFDGDKLAYQKKLIKLFIAGGDSGIKQTRAIKVEGRLYPVSVDFDDNHEIDEPPEPSPSMGLHMDSQQNNHNVSSSDIPLQGQKVNTTTHTAKESGKTLQKLASTIPVSVAGSPPLLIPRSISDIGSCATETVCVVTSAPSISSLPTTSQVDMVSSTVPLTTVEMSVVTRTGNVSIASSPPLTSLPTSSSAMHTVGTMSPTQANFYLGDDMSPKDVMHEYQSTHVMRSPDGTLLGMQSTRAAYYGGSDFTGLRHSVSDSAFLPAVTQGHMSLSQSVPFCHLPESRDAVPESVLNSVADDLGSDWWKLGLELGIEYKEIEKIRYDNQNDLNRQALHMVHSWKRQFGCKATVELLCNALRKCELTNIAESIESLHVEGTSGAH